MKTLPLIALIALVGSVPAVPRCAAKRVAVAVPAADWPQWLGPNRDGKSTEKGLLQKWPMAGPKLEWTFKDAGVGYSSPAVVGGMIYLTGGRNGDEYLFALDMNGKEQWKLKLGPTFDFKGNQWGKGPRAAPTVTNGNVYALGGHGELVCADAKKGTLVWSVHMLKNLKGVINNIGGGPINVAWGYSWAPLVDGDQVICYPGGLAGAAAALNAKTGVVVWRSKDWTVDASYSSPVAAEFGAVKQYVFLSNEGMAGIAAKDGALLWKWDKKPAYADVVIPTPLIHEDHVYVSAGYKPATCDLVKITAAGGKFNAKSLYDRAKGRVMKNVVAGSVIVDGHVYGYSDRAGWVCQDLMSGKEVWAEKDAFGVGSLTYADGHCYLYGEDDGKVALIEASPKGWNLKGEFVIPQKTILKQPSGRNWTPPVIADGKMFLRDQELLFCYTVK